MWQGEEKGCSSGKKACRGCNCNLGSKTPAANDSANANLAHGVTSDRSENGNRYVLRSERSWRQARQRYRYGIDIGQTRHDGT